MSTNLKEDLLLRQTVGLMRYSVWQWQGREIGCGKTTLSLSLKSMWKTRNPFNGETPLISHRLPNSWILLDPRHFFSTPLDDLTISLITTVNWQILPLVNFESF